MKEIQMKYLNAIILRIYAYAIAILTVVQLLKIVIPLPIKLLSFMFIISILMIGISVLSYKVSKDFNSSLISRILLGLYILALFLMDFLQNIMYKEEIQAVIKKGDEYEIQSLSSPFQQYWVIELLIPILTLVLLEWGRKGIVIQEKKRIAIIRLLIFLLFPISLFLLVVVLVTHIFWFTSYRIGEYFDKFATVSYTELQISEIFIDTNYFMMGAYLIACIGIGVNKVKYTSYWREEDTISS